MVNPSRMHIWTRLRPIPGQNRIRHVASAVADAKFSGEDRVICFEWFGDGPPPAPKWHRNIRAEFSPEEQDFVDRALQQIIDDSPPVTKLDSPWLCNMTDGELLHYLWGVDFQAQPRPDTARRGA